MTSDRIKIMPEEVSLSAPTLIIPRKFLFYQCMDFESVPRALRKNWLSQRVKQLSPFLEPANWQVLDQQSAQIWFWDSERARKMHEEQDLPTLQVVPETMLYPQYFDGLQLQPCIEGWDMQYWRSGRLRHSRWLQQEPTEKDKADFVRVSGAEDASWFVAESALLAQPWNEKPFWSKENLTSEPVAPKLILGVLVCYLILQLGLFLGVNLKEKILIASVASKTQHLKKVVAEREAALQLQEFNHAVIELIKRPSQLHLLAQVRNCLSGVNFTLSNWQYQREQLQLVIQQENIDTRALIEACSKDKTFGDVRAEPGIAPNQTRLLLALPVSEGGGKDGR